MMTLEFLLSLAYFT